MPSQFDTIPTPRALHHRAEFGQKEASVGTLPFFSITKSYLTESSGEGYCSVNVNGHLSREVVSIVIPNDEFYAQALLVAQHLWDMGYAVFFVNEKLPAEAGNNHGVPMVYICWGPEMLRRRGVVCPCWGCGLDFKDKKVCVGCPKYDTWVKQRGTRNG